MINNRDTLLVECRSCFEIFDPYSDNNVRCLKCNVKLKCAGMNIKDTF